VRGCCLMVCNLCPDLGAAFRWIHLPRVRIEASLSISEGCPTGTSRVVPPGYLVPS
jgi:hypothetical protein